MSGHSKWSTIKRQKGVNDMAQVRGPMDGSRMHSIIARISLRFSRDAVAWLRAYAFPGNVRELRNLLERACLLCDSDDIDLRFVRAIAARATVISSGDNEDYAHPRPRVMGASARYGRESRATDGEMLPPLLYSTELARSVGLDFAEHARTVAEPRTEYRPEQLEADFDASPTGRYRRLSQLPMATDLVYGLVNVRSDGNRIGTTKRGIGPAYADRAARTGVRMGDLLEPELLPDPLEPRPDPEPVSPLIGQSPERSLSAWRRTWRCGFAP